PKKRRTAPRDCGTANAAPTASTASATASATRRRHARRPASRARTRARRSGVAGKSTASASARSSRSSSGIARHLLPQARERARQPRLDRADRDGERRRRLLVRQVEEVPARDDQPVLLREDVDGG